jgi:hypothetical protein
LAISALAAAAEPLKVTTDENNVILVNGKKFLPIAIWLQPEENFAMWKDLGVNLFIASSHPHKGGTLEKYLQAAEQHNVYVSIGYQWAKREGKLDQVLKHPLVFTLHHNDEPDKPKTKSDAQIDKGANMKVNGQRPLFLMLDGKANTSAVIDPPQGVEFTIKPTKAVTVQKLALAVETGNYTVAREVEFLGDGKSLLKVELANKKGLQEFPLKEPATFAALTVKVLSAYEGKAGFGAIGEVQALDAEGKNVLLSESRLSATETPEEILADYQAIKAADPARLVSLCLMARFMDEVKFQKIPMEMYKQYPPAADLVMFDLYPTSVYKGQNLHWDALGLDELRKLSGPKKALGIWIQASDAMNKDDPGMTPEQIRADVWLSLIHGATFIGYFPQTFNPGFKFHDINEARRAAVKAVNQEVTELADLILSAPKSDLVTVKSEGGRVDVMQREQGDRALVALVNVVERGEGKPLTVTVAPQAFKAAAARVRGRQEPLPLKDGVWTLELKPWETVVLLMDRAK